MAHKKSRPVIFLGVGLLNTLLDFLFYTFLATFVFSGSENIGIVGILSGTFALACAYTTHKLITWRDRPATRLTVVKFFAVTGFGLWVIRPLLLLWFITWEGLYRFAYDVIHSIGILFDYSFVASTGAFAFMVIIVMAYNYFMYSRFVFTESSKSSTEQETH